jgi:hypothetical protein
VDEYVLRTIVGWIKPYPLWVLNHFTLPVAIVSLQKRSLSGACNRASVKTRYGTERAGSVVDMSEETASRTHGATAHTGLAARRIQARFMVCRTPTTLERVIEDLRMKVSPLISSSFCFKTLMPSQRAVQATAQAVAGRGVGSQPQWRRFRRSARAGWQRDARWN